MADGLFYNDLRTPFLTVPPGAVTLTATDKALYPAGQITTALTPGTGTFSIYYGTGADANGVVLAASAAQTLIASQTNQSWALDVVVECLTIGATGTLRWTGRYDYTPAVVATGVDCSPRRPLVLPAPAI